MKALRYTFASRLLAAGLLVLMSLPLGAASDPLTNIRQFLQQGQYDKALPRLNSFLKEHPKHAEARFLKGLALAEQGETEQAKAIFLALTGDYPDLPEPYNNLAVLYAADGEYALARNSLVQAISNHPSYATAHENLGDIYARMAGQSYERAGKLGPTNTTASEKREMIDKLLAPAPK